MSKPRKIYKGRKHKVRIRTFVNGVIQHTKIIERTVYVMGDKYKMWYVDHQRGGSRRQIPVRKLEDRDMFESDRYISSTEASASSKLIDVLRRETA